mmetsp:Transcript_60703/g.104551  ORF Transcript_60703/g.104551 Transcript_60703/m.104551 type:complete len:104 (+) Transcript_60703:293-604(+)
MLMSVWYNKKIYNKHTAISQLHHSPRLPRRPILRMVFILPWKHTSSSASPPDKNPSARLGGKYRSTCVTASSSVVMLPGDLPNPGVPHRSSAHEGSTESSQLK